jgi:tRNA modification GTPase
MYEQDTIAAIATPPGEGGVAIIRISGNEAERIAGRIFIRSQGRNGKLESHRLYHGSIHDPNAHKMLDEVLIAIMRKPRSYTGEDVVEVHCHGGSFLARQILGLIFTLGARQAEPGEFTKRAFLNGKVDLTQAEAVLDLIRARTEKGASIALQQASGELSKHVLELRDDLLDIMVQIEAAIDFPEEEIELLQRQHLIGRIIRLKEILCAISNTYDWGKLFREGAKVSICGRPNVGKSSLLNALIGSERAIVTSVPGTTRDVIEESINLDGLPVILSDTAGIRHTEDLVEQIGVERSRQSLDISDAALIVLDGSEPLTEDDKLLLQSIGPKKCLVAVNKNDLPRQLQSEELRDWVNGATISFVSAKTGAGIERLKGTLRALLLDHQMEPSFAISNVRHRSELTRSATALALAAKTLERGHPPELAAVDLNEAVKALEEIVGAVTNDEILERIFREFCIGK